MIRISGIVLSVFCLCVTRWPVADGLKCSDTSTAHCPGPNCVNDGVEECDEGQENCMTYWSNSTDGRVRVMNSGCWNRDERCHTGSECFSTPEVRIFPNEARQLFCCCTDDFCNRNLRYSHESHLDYERQMKEIQMEDEEAIKGSLQSSSTIPSTATTANDKRETATTPAPLSVVTIAIIVGAAVVAILVMILTMLVLNPALRRKLLGRKKGSGDDVEKELQLSPLLSTEYENQDGSLLLKSIQFIERKAVGRYGEVWKGKMGDVTVAVKTSTNSDVASWKNESHIYHEYLMRHGHSNILKFIIAGKLDQHYLLVTEYHPLGSLSELLKGRVITVEEAEKLMVSMVAGMAYLHDCEGKPSIAHRDFKSTNVLVKDDFSACIGDFGLATAFQPDDLIGDKHGQVGTRRYMSPELLEGAISLNVVSFLRVDMYACALTLWEVVSRCEWTPDMKVGSYRLPFDEELGMSPTNEAIQMAVVHKRIRPAIKEAWKAEPRLRSLCFTIEECWDADPEARPTASCLHNRLVGFVNGCILDESTDGVAS